ncbi:hypothetical protein R75461_07272 [Paraburkholderia nemoris]|uniref:hypothetical protein n=1 Tax=Paraburkholderia nemoris TaxID=2793076 RepID=UPI001909B76A|nr:MULTISPECIES: hypothetical protein [Paraburkholderia]MBK3786074.1 hypothetical protein [Paraburkholderia aspalathi]CAE6846588.1 hypothetical protein R75461_07272 [Paraburkholderia nemoris]
MTKHIIYEREIPLDDERLGLRLYRGKVGLLLERYLVQGDQLSLVQVLPVSSREELQRFVLSDPHRQELAVLYDEVLKRSGFALA